VFLPAFSREALQASATVDTNENPAWTRPKYRTLRAMLATCVAHSSHAIVLANRTSASVAALNLHATIAEKNPDTDTAKPNPV
jgi:hypothetical protein